MSETKKKSVFEVMSAVDVSPYLFEKTIDYRKEVDNAGETKNTRRIY